MTPGPTSTRQRILSALCLTLLIGIVFSPLMRGRFMHWDDRQTIAANSSFNPVRLSSVLSYWSPKNPYMDLYVPVTYTLWGTLAAISPRSAPGPDGVTLSPAVFHGANLVMHAISALAVFQILRKIVRHEWGALIGALIYALHPVQVEPLGWISGGKDVLSGMLGLLSLWAYLRFIEQPPRKWLIYALGLASFMLATLAKPQAVAIPVVALVIDWLLVRKSLSAALVSLAAWFAWCVPIVLVGKSAQPAERLATPILFRPVVAADAVAFYVSKILAPINLLVDYGRSPMWLRSSPQRFWTWLVPVALLVLGWLYRRKAPWALGAMLVLIGAIAPVLGLLPFDFQVYSTVADHYLYVAMLGPALAVAALVERFAARTQPVLLAAVVVLLLGLLSFRQAFVWKDTQTLFQHVYDRNPTSLAAAGVLGVYLTEYGDPVQGLGLLAENVERYPNIPVAHFSFANGLLKHGLVQQALEHFRQAIVLDPSHPEYYTNFGVALAQSGRPDLALKAFEEGARINPRDPDNVKNAAVTLANLGRIDEARERMRQALALAPDRPDIQQALHTLITAPPATAPSETLPAPGTTPTTLPTGD